jgi:hypothetical protein
MAKSIRAKTKMAARKKKREVGNYAAADAARVERLSARLLGRSKAQGGGAAAVKAEGEEGEEIVQEGEDDEEDVPMAEGEKVTSFCVQQLIKARSEAKKVSTSGSREPRREAWRSSKGMDPRGKSKGMNKQGRMGARSGAGRPKRRR